MTVAICKTEEVLVAGKDSDMQICILQVKRHSEFPLLIGVLDGVDRVQFEAFPVYEGIERMKVQHGSDSRRLFGHQE
jgi:hypothetical protein